MAIKIKGLPEYGGQKVKASADVAPEKIDPNVAVSSIKAQGQAKADSIISKGEAIQSITGAAAKVGIALINAKDEANQSKTLINLNNESIALKEFYSSAEDESVFNADFNPQIFLEQGQEK